MTRRRFLELAAAGASGSLLAGRLPAKGASPAARTGTLESFDHAVEDFMRPRRVPGGALAVVRKGKLVYARGYGFADREKSEPARSDSLFRLASLSKPITAIAVLQLVESGKLDLDASVTDWIKLPPLLAAGAKPDPRWQATTLRRLLQHTGGWDRDKSFDPMFRPRQIAQATGETPPPGPKTIIRYMLGQRLGFDPGSRYAYSNFGYCLLGRVIEQVTGMGYEEYVKTRVLAPLGISRMRIGASLRERRADGEVGYYTASNRQVKSVFPSPDGPSGGRRTVPEPYGGFCLEAMDAHGGWLASAEDLAKLTAALNDPARSPLLKADTFRLMYERPSPPVWRQPDGSPTDHYYACGWLVRPVGTKGANYWHNGSLPGTYTLWVRRWDGLGWVALFNQRSENRKLPDQQLDPALHRAADAVTRWP